jgi:ParB-like chromosome segregation protein Spo0J
MPKAKKLRVKSFKLKNKKKNKAYSINGISGNSVSRKHKSSENAKGISEGILGNKNIVINNKLDNSKKSKNDAGKGGSSDMNMMLPLLMSAMRGGGSAPIVVNNPSNNQPPNYNQPPPPPQSDERAFLASIANGLADGLRNSLSQREPQQHQRIPDLNDDVRVRSRASSAASNDSNDSSFRVISPAPSLSALNQPIIRPTPLMPPPRPIFNMPPFVPDFKLPVFNKPPTPPKIDSFKFDSLDVQIGTRYSPPVVKPIIQPSILSAFSRVPSPQLGSVAASRVPTPQPTRIATPQPVSQPDRVPTPQPARAATPQPVSQPDRVPTPQPARAATPQPASQPDRVPTPAPASQPDRVPTPVPNRPDVEMKIPTTIGNKRGKMSTPSDDASPVVIQAPKRALFNTGMKEPATGKAAMKAGLMATPAILRPNTSIPASQSLSLTPDFLRMTPSTDIVKAQMLKDLEGNKRPTAADLGFSNPAPLGTQSAAAAPPEDVEMEEKNDIRYEKIGEPVFMTLKLKENDTSKQKIYNTGINVEIKEKLYPVALMKGHKILLKVEGEWQNLESSDYEQYTNNIWERLQENDIYDYPKDKTTATSAAAAAAPPNSGIFESSQINYVNPELIEEGKPTLSTFEMETPGKRKSKRDLYFTGKSVSFLDNKGKTVKFPLYLGIKKGIHTQVNGKMIDSSDANPVLKKAFQQIMDSEDGLLTRIAADEAFNKRTKLRNEDTIKTPAKKRL